MIKSVRRKMGSGFSKKSGSPTLYLFPFSAPCRAVLMTAKAINVKLDEKTVDLLKKEQLEDSFTAINPDHTVPTLVDGPLRLWESRPIMQYLVDAYAPDHAVYPRAPDRRAPIDRMLNYDLGTAYRHISAFIYPQLFEKKPADPKLKEEVEKVLEYLNKQLEKQKFMASATLTIADLSLAATLSVLEVKDWDFEKWPKLQQWRTTIKALPYYDECNAAVGEFLKQMSGQ